MKHRNVLAMVSPMSAERVNGFARYAKEHGWNLMIQDRLGHTSLAWKGDPCRPSSGSWQTCCPTVARTTGLASSNGFAPISRRSTSPSPSSPTTRRTPRASSTRRKNSE